ncbi:hypothetical protein Sjap_015199 [Stephania japonica]|uniref:Protein FAM91A1 n=1 Tax=Stephania japonica TaxID=461633 RepID=A0AAP0IKJ5_9MAGN
MQRVPATIEEQLLLKAIKDECPWENLPKRLQATLQSKEEWHRRVVDHSIKNDFNGIPVLLAKFAKKLFPYHLAEYVCRVMRVSPFRYYCDMIFEVMKNEQPYDSIPNFSAADAFRLTGIGRNEFIDIMNKCRSKKLSDEEMATVDKVCKEEANSFILFDSVVIKGLYRRGLIYFDVPVFPDDRFKVSRLEGFISNREQSYEDPIEELLYAVFVVSSENATVAELATTLQADLSQLQHAASFACRLGWAVKLIDPASVLQDSSLSGPLSTILSDEEDASHSTAGSASMLVDSNSVPRDISMMEKYRTTSGASRVAFIVDANITSYLMMGSVSPARHCPPQPHRCRPLLQSSPISIPTAIAPSLAHLPLPTRSSRLDLHIWPKERGCCPHHREKVAAVGRPEKWMHVQVRLLDLCPGLKSHAVTLYEAGKLGDASIAELCKDLATLEGAKFEGELQEFANHAFSLRCALECLQSGGVCPDATVDNIDKNIEQSSTKNTGDLFSTDISISESSNSFKSEGGENRDEDFQSTTKYGMPQDGDILVESAAENTIEGMDSPNLLKTTSFSNDDPKCEPCHQKDETSILTEATACGREIANKRRKYHVDILRCESLAALAPATLNRLFHRDYEIVVSMVPLPSSSVLPGPIGPIHFGPPSYSSMTPWMKLVLYASAASGPLSVVLMKGQCLRLLPVPLAGCDKAIIWSWDGSTVGGLGGKFEGNLVNGRILLHCLNSLLKYSAVLVQPLSKADLVESGKIITIDIPLPLKNSDGSVAPVGEEMGLSKEETSQLNCLLTDLCDKIDLCTIGYIRLLRLFKETEQDYFSTNDKQYEWVLLSVEFGIPLFSPKLCRAICQRVILSQLLQSDSLVEHHDAMQTLRKRLRDICAEYHAVGPISKLLYQKEYAKEPSRQLIHYASGRWNPLDPSSPISGVLSEHQRLKLANRQRSLTEVLSFDGSILRSYALTPVYEAATRPIEESPAITKAETDDADSKEVTLPGVNLIFDGSELIPFDIGACLQARLPVSLIADASAVSASPCHSVVIGFSAASMIVCNVHQRLPATVEVALLWCCLRETGGRLDLRKKTLRKKIFWS